MTERFKYICVLDFEASCDTELQMKRGEMEIIEFPSVLLDVDTLTIMSEFQQFVKLNKYSKVSSYCTEVTGITQEILDNEGLHFTEVLTNHQEWLKSYGIPQQFNCLFITCGDWDLKTMLPRECKEFNLECPEIYSKWLNIKEPFCELTKKEPTGMAGMLKTLKLELSGRHHSGIDDCRNIMKIVINLLEREINLIPSSEYKNQQYHHLNAYSVASRSRRIKIRK